MPLTGVINYVFCIYGRSKDRSAYLKKPGIGIGSQSDCLLGQLKRILDISDSDAGVKEDNWKVQLEETVNVGMK